MTEPGEMRRPGPERARSERWLDELAELRQGGPVRRYATRTRVVMSSEQVEPGDPDFSVLAELVLRNGRHRPVVDHVEVGLYPLGPAAGTVPTAIVEVPPGEWSRPSTARVARSTCGASRHRAGRSCSSSTTAR
jgi:hypothetical protein